MMGHLEGVALLQSWHLNLVIKWVDYKGVTHVGCLNAWNSSCVIILMSVRTCNPLPW
jgi:hypothetical protein